MMTTSNFSMANDPATSAIVEKSIDATSRPISALPTCARYLRKSATDCERLLWRHLRNRNFANYKFRRQHPVDRYILDFYCPQARLGVELDGGGHGYIRRRMHDRDRTEFLASQKIMV